MEALKGIHHVSDKVLFEEKLTQKTKMIENVNDNRLSQSFDNTHWIEAADIGYKFDEKIHYCIINCETE